MTSPEKELVMYSGAGGRRSGAVIRQRPKNLDEVGRGALSMREVARRAECTHQAPYHYFADRESILAALVVEGFEALAKRLEAAHALADTQGVRAGLMASASA